MDDETYKMITKLLSEIKKLKKRVEILENKKTNKNIKKSNSKKISKIESMKKQIDNLSERFDPDNMI